MVKKAALFKKSNGALRGGTFFAGGQDMRRFKNVIATVVVLAAFLFLGQQVTRAFVPEEAAKKAASLQTAVFAGGCFWCMEAEFDQKEGVASVQSGFMGGAAENATYYDVATGETGHIEVVEIKFDPAVVTYEELLKIFWENVDPTDAEGQFCDKGSQYAAGIFYFDDAQKAAAEKSLRAVEEKLGQKVVTFIREALVFYPADEYHQEYYKKNALQYALYKKGCGREKRLEEIWSALKEPAAETPLEKPAE